MDYIVRSLQQNPELAIFLTLAVGAASSSAASASGSSSVRFWRGS